MTGMNTVKAMEADGRVYGEFKHLKGRERFDLSQQARREIYGEWRKWLWEQYGYDLPSAIEPVIYKKAWDDYHANGLYSVENEFEDLCNFAREVQDPTPREFGAWL